MFPRACKAREEGCLEHMIDGIVKRTQFDTLTGALDSL